jgi:hypothetical protein
MFVWANSLPDLVQNRRPDLRSAMNSVKSFATSSGRSTCDPRRLMVVQYCSSDKGLA